VHSTNIAYQQPVSTASNMQRMDCQQCFEAF
jgi:hypothetical protein